VHNDKFDSKKVALLGLNPAFKVSLIPTGLVLNLRSLTRKYFNLMDTRSTYVNKLLGQLRLAFPQFPEIFLKVIGEISLMIIKDYTTPKIFYLLIKDYLLLLLQRFLEKMLVMLLRSMKTLLKLLLKLLHSVM
jgi:hypothetical protein